MKTLSTLIFLSLFVLGAQSQDNDVAGHTYVTSNCASGGFDYHFLHDGKVVAVCDGCEWIPYVMQGQWYIENNHVVAIFETSWMGKGEGEVVMASSVNHYKDYVAAREDKETEELIPLSLFTGSEEDGCSEVIETNFQIRDAYDFIRDDFGKHYKASTMRLSDEDLENYGLAELRLMRNEIFARYGYEFKSEDLQKHFAQFDGYNPFYSNVSAFLTQIEKDNIALIKKWEKAKK